LSLVPRTPQAVPGQVPQADGGREFLAVATSRAAKEGALSTLVETLLANTTLLIAVGAVYALLNRSRLGPPWLRSAMLGLLFGCGAFAVMQASIRLGDGIIFDARGVILGLAPVFGGPIAGVLAGAIAAGGRLWIGGAGAVMGVLAIVIAVGGGMAYRAWVRGEITQLPSWHFLALGLVIHVVTALCFPLLLPAEPGWAAFSQVGPAMVVVDTPATWLLAFIMQVFEAHRRQAQAIADERSLLQLRNAQLQGIRDIESAYIAGAAKQQIYDPMLAVILDLTDSEYGFVGELLRDPDGTPYLKVWSITNIAWNPAMQQIYEDSIGRGIEFRRLDTLFGAVLTSGKPVIANDPAADPRRGGLPAGHPALNKFLGLPIYSGDRLVGMMGVGNRAGGYDEAQVEMLQPLTHACGLVIAGLAERAAGDQAKAAMQESAARLELAVTAGNIGIWIWELATDRMYFSPEWKRQLGHEDHEIGDSHEEWTSRLHPEDAPETLATTERFIADPWPGFTVEFRLRHKDGSYRWILAQASLTHGVDGKPVRMMGTHVDITGHKEAERELTREASRRQLLFEKAPDGIFLLNSDIAVVEANQSFAHMLGLELEDVIGLSPWDWDVNYTSRGSILAAFPEPPRAPTTFMTRMRRRDGTVFDAEVNSVVVDWAGEGSVFNVCRDVTERMRAEDRLRELSTAVEQSPASIVITDTDGLIKYVNPRYEQITGYRAAEVLGKVPNVLRPGVLPEAELDALRAAIAAGGEWRGEFQSVRKDGESYWELGSVSAIRAPDGRVTNYILIREDISRSKAIEAQLRQAQKMEAIGQLTAGMAHDFNNLLAIMVGNLELAVEATGDQVVHDKVATALRAAQRGAALTRQLLAFGRRAPLQPQATDLNTLVAELEPLLRRTLGAGIEVEARQAPSVDPVMIDRNQMENAILNLAINARDAMPRGGKLTIETGEIALDGGEAGDVAPGRYAMIAVSDNGVGMAPDVLAHAFEPFFTTKSVGKGSGLGLSMVYGFVKQSGGHARIYSEPGRGTSVKVYFPISGGAIGALADPDDREARIAAVGRERILVLENDDDVRETVGSQLVSLGYSVVTRDTGTGAIGLIDRGERVDLLLSDVVLGGADSGPDIAEQIRLRRPEIKVIFMSGYTERAAINGHGVAAGDRVLQKPVTRVDLAHAIRKELGNDSN
jgi:PAS domain S-box-containing protein